MLYQILELIVSTVAIVIGEALLLRAYLQVVGAGRNPLAQFSIAVTNWIVLPLRRIIKPHRGVDWASIVGAFIIALAQVLILTLAISALEGYLSINPLALVLQVVVIVVKWAIWLAIGLTVLYAVIGWVNPDSPLSPTLDLIMAPLLRPIRRLIRPVGGFDLSPMVLILLLLIVQLVVENGARQLMVLALTV
ncbi:YggT family protein [soil metagenome]